LSRLGLCDTPRAGEAHPAAGRTRFLVDAMSPRRLARRLNVSGHDAVHTLDLPRANRTRDRDIRALADRDGREVVTKAAAADLVGGM